MASQTLWNNKTIVKAVSGLTPEVRSTAVCEYERAGTYLNIKVDVDNYCPQNGAYWDWRWAFSVLVNGQEVTSNIQIKPRTYLNKLQGEHFTASSGWASVNIGSASSVNIEVKYFDTVANHNDRIRSSMGSGFVTLGGIPPLPNVSISENNKSHNTIIINYSVSSNYDYVRVWVNNKQYGDFTNSPVTITGLNPNTTYNIYAKAYGNGAFGNQSNTLTIKTYLTPSTVSSSLVTNIKPFSCTASVKSSNASNTSSYEFALCNTNKSVVQGAFTTYSSNYNFKNLNEETSYYIRYRVQSKDSGAWSNYVYSELFKTPADQAQSYLKKNNSYSKGKIYLKKNGQWIKVKKAYIKVNGIWVLTKNK